VRVRVGDWGWGYDHKGHKVDGFVQEVDYEAHYAHIFVTRTYSIQSNQLHQEIWVDLDTFKVYRQLEFVGHGQILNMIDIALDDKDKKEFKKWASLLQQHSTSQKEVAGCDSPSNTSPA
jgi:uncharacterized protein YpiB (UPF0302 family)